MGALSELGEKKSIDIIILTRFTTSENLCDVRTLDDIKKGDGWIVTRAGVREPCEKHHIVAEMEIAGASNLECLFNTEVKKRG